MRLDLFLVKSKSGLTRTQAQDMIENKYVFLKKPDKTTLLTKASFDVTEDIEKYIFIAENPLQKYVSRAGLKLESALTHLKLDVAGLNVLDVGQSTGGFTDCLIQAGAKQVVGLDVGNAQLHTSLKENSKVISIEDLNAKELANSQTFLSHVPANGFDLIVMDVSFISITKVIDFLKPYLGKNKDYLFLVKPQFEAGADALDRNGIVKDEKIFSVIQNQIKEKSLKVFGDVQDYFKSTLPGKDGNQEFFIYGKNKI